jgi:hypothetical protein
MTLTILSTFISVTLVAQIASPGPTPLKLIAHVRTSMLCTTLRDNLFHAVQGLRTDDGIVQQGRLELAKMAVDSIAGKGQKARQVEPKRTSSGSLENSALKMDHYQMNYLIQDLTRNLAQIEALLSDQKIFVASPSSPEQVALASAKGQLEAVVAQQNVELNLLSGTAESTSLQMLAAKGDNTAGALEQDSHPDADVDLQNQVVGANAPAQSPKAAASLFANNAFGQLAVLTMAQETVTGAAEDKVLPTLMPIINACH